MNNMRPAEVFPPGEFIKEELEARDWTQSELAEIMGRSPKEISDIVSAKRAISPEIAKELEAALGPSAGYWLNLETSYRLWRQEATDDAIARRARLRSIAPIQELVKRHWIEGSENVTVTENSVKRFLEVSDLDEEPRLRYAARKSTKETSSAQLVWLYRAKHLARALQVRAFSAQALDHALVELRALASNAQDAANVPQVLEEAGIRFLIIEQIPKTKIDGAVLWLDEKSPVVVLSLRFDRIDYFWHTLFHELGHVKHRDGAESRDCPIVDIDIVGQTAEPVEDDAEKSADQFATEFLVDQSELNSFIARIDPLYAKQRIINFAAKVKVHPGIVVGQLQFRRKVAWSSFRPMLEKVRHIVVQRAVTDGWGRVPATAE